MAASFSDRGQTTDLLLDARASRDDRATQFGDVTSSVFASSTVEERTMGVGVVSESHLGFANVEMQHARRGNEGGLGYTGNARFSIVSDDGRAAWGGRRSELSAVVLDIDDVGDTEFAVLVDRQPAGRVRSGRRSVVGLDPYRTYEIRLEPRGQAFVEFDERPRTVTLYPGNVETLRFEAVAVTVVVGQIVDADGRPVANARFDGTSGFAGTDDSGWFQVEIAARDPVSVRRPDAPDCVIHWPAFEADEGLAVLGPVTCRTIPATR